MAQVSSTDRNKIVEQQFIDLVLAGELPDVISSLTPAQVGLRNSDLLELFLSQVTSRHLDLHSRVMQKQGQSFYTIGSAGHEGNAAYGRAFSVKDIAFLHYRSGAFMVERARQVAEQDPIRDILLSFAASSEDPISAGRHKVLGSKILNVPPQTSTIASHLPKAVGTAFSIGLSRRLNLTAPLAVDSVVVCSFGDASANHSTAQGAFNSAAWAAYQSVPLPLVFICEDNGIGISTATPTGWIKANFKDRAGLIYLECNGLDLLDTYQQAQRARAIALEQQKPVFLHVNLVRLLGHAGSDSEFSYRSQTEIEASEAQDPLLYSAALLLKHQVANRQALVDYYLDIQTQITKVAAEVVQKPKLSSSQAVMASLVPTERRPSSAISVTAEYRQQLFSHEQHNINKPQHMAKLINWALHDLMASFENIVLCGEDIGKKGGVYSVTSKLCDNFGQNRVVNTLLDEQSILGGAIGLAHNGFLPIPEIQFLAYVHNAEDQIRGEAATLSFFSDSQFTNPMVIRIAGLGYQKGFGGHFHNDNSFAVFRDIPGLVLACPSNGQDAVEMLRNCVRLADEEQRVVVFLEPIALYMTKDLHETGDGLWSFDYFPPAEQVRNPSEQTARVSEQLTVASYGQGEDLCLLSYGNGYYLSRQAEPLLAALGINCRVVDLRYLAPLDQQGILEQVSACRHVLIVDECRQTGSISEALISLLIENGISLPQVVRVTAEDSFIPLGKAAYCVLPSVEQIVNAAESISQVN